MGTTNNDWFTNSNWLFGTPSSTTNAGIVTSLTLATAPTVAQPGAIAEAVFLDGGNKLLITGAGSTLAITNDLSIGNVVNGGSTSKVTISNGGAVVSRRTFIGDGFNAGTIIVSGAGSTLTTSGGPAGYRFVVGGFGFGTLQIDGGGTVNAGAAGDQKLEIGQAGHADGILQLGVGGTSGTLNATQIVFGTAGSKIAVNNTDIVTLSAAIGGAGSVSKNGSGTLVLAGNEGYTGGTTISGGTLQLGNGGASGSIFGNVLDNGLFAINRSNAFTFGAVISGSGAFEQRGIGTTTLTAKNAYTGATTVTAGTLTIASSGSIVSNVTNSATFINAGTVNGSLINTGTVINSGIVTGNVSNLAGTVTNTGFLLGGLANNGIIGANGGAINGAIANAGSVTVGGQVSSDSTFNNAAGATLGIAATGRYAIQGLLTNSGLLDVKSGGQLTAAVGGITNTAGGNIVVASNGLLLNNSLSNAGSITNNGSIGSFVTNTGTIINNANWLGDISNAGTFTNNTGAFVSDILINTAGVAVNNGFIGRGATVNGGVLTGSGTIGGDLLVNGGTFAPGDGTPHSAMFVVGNLAFQSGAQYLVTIDRGTSTGTAVFGTASLDGRASAAFVGGSPIEKRYIILNAQTLGGRFNSIDTIGMPAGFQASLSYDTHRVFLDLDLNFATLGRLNANQQAVATALSNFFNKTGGIPFQFGALGPAGLTQISGEAATGSQQTTFQAMTQFMGVMTDPFIAGRGDPVLSSTGATPFAEDDGSASVYAANARPRSKTERDAYAAIHRKALVMDDPFTQRWSVWAAGYGGSQITDGTTAFGSNNTRSSIGGVAVGADYRFSPNTLAGFAIAGGGTNFSVNGLGNGRSDLFQAGAFVRHNFGPAYFTAALAYGWQDVTTDRTVTIAGADLLRANFNANAYSGRVEGGYRLVAPWVGGVGITPYVAGQFTTFDLPAYAEQAIAGANTFALTYASKSATDSRSELGVRTDKSFAMPNGILTLRGRAAWAHDFNTDRSIVPTFQTLPGASFVVNGAAQAPDAALLTGSAEMKWLNGFSLAAIFEGEFSSVTRSYAGKGVARYAW